MLIKHFNLKDIGVVDVILLINISKTTERMSLTQSYYIETLLMKFKAYDYNPAKTLVDLSLHLAKNNGQPISQFEYSRAIGSLMYINNCTYPNTAYAVNKLSRFTSYPENNHWKALIRVLKYLTHTVN